MELFQCMYQKGSAIGTITVMEELSAGESCACVPRVTSLQRETLSVSKKEVRCMIQFSLLPFLFLTNLLHSVIRF